MAKITLEDIKETNLHLVIKWRAEELKLDGLKSYLTQDYDRNVVVMIEYKGQRDSRKFSLYDDVEAVTQILFRMITSFVKKKPVPGIILTRGNCQGRGRPAKQWEIIKNYRSW